MRRTALFLACLPIVLAAPALAADAPDATDFQVCAIAAALSPPFLANYLVSDAFLDIDGDGRAEHLSAPEYGTARLPEFTIARGDGARVEIAWAAVDGADDDWGWAQTERWMIFAGRAYGLRFQGWGTGYLRYLSRIDAGFVEHALCKFAPQTSVQLAPRTPGDSAVCTAVANKSVAYTPVTPIAPPQSVTGHEVLAARTQAVGQAIVDYANTGRPAPLALLSASSGAGPGCDLRFYDKLPAEPHLAAMQGLDFTDTAYPRRTCLDDTPLWFTFGGVTYLETKSTEADAPSGERGEYHFVDTVQDGLPRRVCEASYLHGPPKLVGVWQGSNWVRPPTVLPAPPR